MKLHSAAVLLIGISIISCKKSSDDNPTDPNTDCKVVRYRCESRNETWRIVYNASGNLDSILIGDAQNVDEIRTFHYDGIHNTITVKRDYKGTPGHTSTVEATPLGKIMSIRDHGVNQSWQHRTYVYSSDARSLIEKSILSIYGATESFESYYNWDANANTDPLALLMRTHTTISGEFTYGYYLDKLHQPGDYLEFEKIIAAYDKYYEPFTSSHLVKSIKRDGDPLVDVTYTFNNDGQITRFAVHYDGDPEPEIWDLTYQCK